MRQPATAPPPTRPVAVVAHRGASVAAPENTLAAVRTAVARGADHVEVDVHRSRDGALVVVHDTTVARTTDAERVLPGRGPWRVADLTLAQLRRLDAGAWHSPSHAGERVPLLSEVVDLVHRSGVGLLLEVKSPHLYPGIADDLAAELADVPGYLDDALAADRLVVQSFDARALAAFKDRAPAVPVGVLGSPPRRRLPALAAWVAQVNPRHVRVRRSYVDAVHAAGLRCQVWTVDDTAAMARAVAIGVDGVITNRPDVLRRLLSTSVAPAA